VTYEDGTNERVGMFADGFLTGFPEGQRYTRRAFDPGLTVTRRLGVQLRAASITSISIMPIAVVFDDGTALGDEGIISQIFPNRDRERRAILFLERLIKEELDLGGDLATSLSVIERRLREVRENEVRNSHTYVQLSQNLTPVPAPDAREKDTLRLTVQRLLDELRLRRALAEKHYSRH
jgi:hypothetical protein